MSIFGVDEDIYENNKRYMELRVKLTERRIEELEDTVNALLDKLKYAKEVIPEHKEPKKVKLVKKTKGYLEKKEKENRVFSEWDFRAQELVNTQSFQQGFPALNLLGGIE